MSRIIWQSDSRTLVDAFQTGVLPNDASGGDAYEFNAAMALATEHNVMMDRVTVRRPADNPLTYRLRLHRNKIAGDVFVASRSVISHGSLAGPAKRVGLLHHIYLQSRERSFRGRLGLAAIKRRLLQMDLVVVESKFWADYAESLGCKNVRIIHCAFDLEQFAFTRSEAESVLEKHHIPTDKPIVYIGYARAGKGVVEVYDALKDQPYTLVMTGPKHDRIKIDAHWLCLDRLDYLRLLAACDVVVTMSQIEEGWCMIAHEAMLCKTPVIGSGSGGMRELLESGGQLLCTNSKELPGMVRHALANRDLLAERGRTYAQTFDVKHFNNSWRTLMSEITGPTV